MTLTIGLQGSDFVVLGCDSRGTFGDPRGAQAIIDVMIKTSILAPHVGVVMSGAGELGDALTEEFITSHRGTGLDGTTEVMKQFRAHLAQKWNEYFATVPFEHRPPCIFTVGGLDPGSQGYNIPIIYTLLSLFGFAPSLHRYGFACTGVPSYATYILNRRYDRTASADALAGLVAFAIRETASQDQRVGGPIRIIIIKPEGIVELNQAQIENLLRAY